MTPQIPWNGSDRRVTCAGVVAIATRVMTRPIIAPRRAARPCPLLAAWPAPAACAVLAACAALEGFFPRTCKPVVRRRDRRPARERRTDAAVWGAVARAHR